MEELPESRLGTKEHWDEVYEREFDTYKVIGDEGEVWFGEDSVERMVEYLSQVLEGTHLDCAPYVLDLGTGNGHLLFSLWEAREDMRDGALDSAKLLGVDYSKASIDLCRTIALQRGNGCETIHFDEADLRDAASIRQLVAEGNRGRGWDIVCDKGTLDAIALSSQPLQGKLPVDLYMEAVTQLTRAPAGAEMGGIFLITSCNFTEDELVIRFEPAGFTMEEVLPSPSFTFVRKPRKLTSGRPARFHSVVALRTFFSVMPLHSDLCVRLQNAARAKLRSVPVANTKANLWITSILLQHGFIYNVARGTIAGPSAQDWNKAPDVRRRLWVDLKYRSDDRPVLENMNLVSKPSRRLSMSNDELLRWVTGRRAKFVTPLRAGEIGIIDCGKDGWFEAKEAMRRKLQGEVVCRVS